MFRAQPDFQNRVTRPDRIRELTINPEIFSSPNRFVDAVFEGGATLGAAYAGSLTLLGNARVGFSRVAGNSAGAITAALVAAGYTAAEVEWLMSNVSNPRVARPASLRGASPIDFMDLLDFPTVDQISRQTMRKTVLWKALQGAVIDEVLKTRLPIPTRREVVNDVVANLKLFSPPLRILLTDPVERAVRDMLDVVLVFLPTSTPRLRDFSLFDETAGLRTAFADDVWRAIARQFPLFLMSTNFLHEGGLFEGDAFRSVLDVVLRAKISGGGAPVQFRDLKIPLAVIAYDFDLGLMVVYSTQTHPRMEVAEAVRRSMSIPLLWQARKRDPFNQGSAMTETIVDGGLASNFPAWLFTAAGDSYWPPDSIDPSRPKIGFSLDESLAPPAAWGAGPGKFALTRPLGSPPGSPLRVDGWPVVRSILVAKLKEAGIAVPDEAAISAELDALTYLRVTFGALGAKGPFEALGDDKEQIMRDIIIPQLMTGLTFYDVVIPLLGYHGFDFSVNSDRDDLDGIAERGFLATRAVLGTGTLAQPAFLPTVAAMDNPYA